MKKAVLLLMVLLLAVGCGKAEAADGEDKPYTVDPEDGDVIIVYADGYATENFAALPEETKVGGLLCRADDILVVDTAGNNILRFNYDGELIETVGSTGNGDGEFLYPRDLRACGDKLYLLDAKNMRIVVLSQNLSFEKEISLEGLGTSGFTARHDSMAVLDENTIFLTSNNDRKAFLLKDQKELITVEEEFQGICAVGGGKAYIVQNMVSTGGGNAETGNVFYAEYDEERGLVKNQLPYNNRPVDIVILGEDMYVLNGLYGAVERCDLNGDYNETLYKFLKTINDRFVFTQLAMDAEGNFYVADNYNHAIYKVYKEK